MATIITQGKYDAQNPLALKRLVANGALLRPFSAEILTACYNAANEVYAEISAKNEDFKKGYESLADFRSNGYLWWQVTEYGFDSFMIRAQAARKG